MTYATRRAAFFFCLFSAGCMASAPENGPECNLADNKECPAGQACLDFVCHDLCDSVADCARNEACLQQLCQEYSASCSTPDECVDGWFCKDGACRRDLTLGNVCADDTECDRGQCTDGVCCESVCGGECVACSFDLTGQTSGLCAGIPVNEDPESECGTIRGCDGTGACLPVSPSGALCATGETCASGFCVDGVCCDSSCGGVCEACVELRTGVASGLCAPIPEGVDPEDDCTGTILTCSGLRSCKGMLGESCSASAECLSDYCANDLCSDPPIVSIPDPYSPWNGFTTGSVHAAKSLRPRFRWNASSGGVGALTYQLQVDDSCMIAGYHSCTIPSPEVDVVLSVVDHTLVSELAVETTAPVGRRYYWRVRACDELATCSPWSAIRYLDVGRQSKDINGDGYADVVVGLAEYRVSYQVIGGSFFFYGGSTGLGATADVRTGYGGEYGRDVAIVGDLNADGFADAAVTERLVSALSGSIARVGAIHVYYGSAAGISTTVTTITSPVLERDTLFGASLAPAGDHNADGYADFVVGTPWIPDPTRGDGKLFVFAGSQGIISTTPVQILDNPIATDIGRFGDRLAGGVDFNGDGFTDLVANSPWKDQNDPDKQAFVHLFHGAASEFEPLPALTLETTAHTGFRLPIQILTDSDGDGYGDIALGAMGHIDDPVPTTASKMGAVMIHHGSATGVAVSPTIVRNPRSIDDGSFGFGMLFAGGGDNDGDNKTDLLVGDLSPVDSANGIHGRVYATTAGAAFSIQISSDLANPLNATTSSLFGVGMAGVGDLDGDSFDDAVVRARYTTPNVDETTVHEIIYVFLGGVTGLQSSVPATIAFHSFDVLVTQKAVGARDGID